MREKYKPIMAQYYIADGVNWVPRLFVGLNEKLDLQVHSRNGTRPHVGDLTVHTFFVKSFSIIVYHRIMNISIVPCGIQ